MTDINELVDALTLEEQVSLLSGEDFWSLPAIERLGIGKLRVTDGPNGARGGGSLIGGVKSAAFPVGIAIGATWNVTLAQEIGTALAREVKAKGAHVSLAPTVNIHRSVANGRNFECYSEDAELTAALAVGYIRGLQENGVSATIKHFAGNESEIERMTMDSVVSERALREIYLRPFEDAVREAGTWGVMSSYNRLNGPYTSDSRWLLTEVLRGDWGYDGVVMSDWFGSHSTADSVNAGLDIEMPGPTRDRGDQLVAAVKAGEVAPETIRTRALNVLRLMERTGALQGSAPFEERSEDRPEDRALIRRAGAEAAVLLKNEGLLPLTPGGRVAVIGPNAKVARIMGGGSAQLNPVHAISPWDGLAARLGEEALRFAKGCSNHRFEPVWSGDLQVAFYEGRDFSGDPVHVDTMEEAQAFWNPPLAGGKVDPTHFSARVTGTFTPEADGTYRIGLHSVGLSRLYVNGTLVADAWEGWTPGRTFFEQGCDPVLGEIALTAGEPAEVLIEFASLDQVGLGFAALYAGIGLPLGEEAIEEAVRAASEAETAILFVGRSGEWDTEGSDLEDIALPGRQDDLIARVVAANPRTVVVLQTGGPVEMPWLDDAPAVLQAWYPGQEAGHAIADVLYGDAEPGGRLPQSFPRRWADNPTFSQDPEVYPGQDGKVRYEEGVFIGYRHYDKVGIEPLFPFGFGLSYTDFTLTGLAVEAAEDGALARLTVSNTGDRAGSTVVQLYLGEDGAPLPRPVRELKAFEKLALEPGESREVMLSLPPRAFAWYDEGGACWRVTGGSYRIEAGFSAADLRQQADVEIGAAVIAKEAQR